MPLETRIARDRPWPRRVHLHFDFFVPEELLERLADPLFVVHDHDAAGTHGAVPRRFYSTTPVVCTFTSETAGSSFSGTAPFADAPPICFVICFTKGPGISMPRRLISVMS